MSVSRALAAAAEMYGTTMTTTQLQGYLEALKVRHPRDVTASIAICIRECKYFPKVADIIERIPTKAVTFIDEVQLTDSERALNAELGPLFSAYLNREVTKQEWLDQMQYFATKHGLGDTMQRAIQREVL